MSHIIFDEGGYNKRFEYYRTHGCPLNIKNTPFGNYQIQKKIQHTVGVDSSQYTMNLGALQAHEEGYWNQMSDRNRPHVQQVVGGNPIGRGNNSQRRTPTCLRPGALSPGGIGCDIKHNSYDRHLNKLKGRAVLRREVIPKIYEPVKGGKVTKTNIVSRYTCKKPNLNSCEEFFQPDLYATVICQKNNSYNSKNNKIQHQPQCKCKNCLYYVSPVVHLFKVGQIVWLKRPNESNNIDKLYCARVIRTYANKVQIQFQNGMDCAIVDYNDIVKCSGTYNSPACEIVFPAVKEIVESWQNENTGLITQCNIPSFLNF